MEAHKNMGCYLEKSGAMLYVMAIALCDSLWVMQRKS